MPISGNKASTLTIATITATDLQVEDLNRYQITFQVDDLGVNTALIEAQGPSGEWVTLTAAAADNAIEVIGAAGGAYYSAVRFTASAGTLTVYWTAVEKGTHWI